MTRPWGVRRITRAFGYNSGPVLALAILALATAAPASGSTPPSPAPPRLELKGVWRGREVSDAVGVRNPMLTFKDARGSLTYEDRAGGAGSMSVRIDSIVVQGASVRFAVAGPGGRRFYRGRWDGRTITGSIAADASGATPVGTFELARQEYDDSPRLPMTLTARGAGRTGRPASPPPAVRVEPLFYSDDRDAEREARERRVGMRLSQVAGGPDVLDTMIDDYHSRCPIAGAPLNDAPLPDCDGMARQISRAASMVNKVIDEAEDEARRAQVQPGTVRDLRTRLGVDEGDWARVNARVREIETEAARRRR